MVTAQTAAALLPPYQGKKHITSVMGLGNNRILVSAILKNYPLAVAQTKRLANQFNTGSLESTGQAVWQFLRSQINYKEDSGLFQHIKAPSALATVKNGDCKSFSTFAAGIMANLGYPVTYRFAGYDGSQHPGHVYILAGKPGNQIIIDGVWHTYNSEKKPYTFKKDYKMEIATITGTDCGCKNISGCNCDPIGKIQLKKVLQKAKEAVKTTAKKAGEAVKNTTEAAARQAADLAKKAAGMAPRTAFLQLVKLNVHSFATKLDRKRESALAKWAKLGGNTGELNASINAGKTRKPILGIENHPVTEGIGIAAVTVAATLAAAAPIIAVMAEFLSSKIEAPTEGSPTETAPTSSTAAPTEKPGETATKILEGATKILETFTGKKEQSTTSATNSGNMYSQAQDTAPLQPSSISTDQPNTKWILPALAVGALLLLAKK